MLYTDRLNLVISLIKSRRNEKMEEIFTFGAYGLKGMFLEKYTPLKQILDSGVVETVNISLYKNNVLVLEEVDKETFSALYEQVALKVLEIEQKYQAYLVELANNPTEARLDYLEENNVF